jgi:hypothetical protein
MPSSTQRAVNTGFSKRQQNKTKTAAQCRSELRQCGSQSGEDVHVGLLACNVLWTRKLRHRLGNGGSTFDRNVGIYAQVHTALQIRRPTSILRT